jgi:adenylate cyclase
LNACVAAIELRDAIDRFNASLPAAKRLPTRLGLDAGEVGLGPVAGELQAVGLPASVATRIQELNKELGTRLLASAAVVDALDTLLLRPLGSFDLHGTSSRVEVVEILGRRDAVGDRERQLCAAFAAGLDHYASSRWSDAATVFQRMAAEYPEDGPIRYYRDRSAQHAAARPAGGEPIEQSDTSGV